MFSIDPSRKDELDHFIKNLIEPSFKAAYCGDNLITLEKTAGFLEEPRFARAFARHARTEEERSRAWRLHTLVWAAESALNLPGDFVECGVFEGFMSSVVMDVLEFEKRDKTFYLYDTFEGFSDKYSDPDDYGPTSGFYRFAQKLYDQPGLYERVRQRFAPWPNAKVIRGVVPDVFAEDSPERICYLHVDLNAPRAERGALEALFDRVVPGGMVVFDDHGWKVFYKQKAEHDAFMRARGYAVMELPTGQGLVIKR